MNRVKVSVIVPVYNTAQYVEEAILSVLNQTLKEIEVIAVNDGSTDTSLVVLQRLAETDNRLRIISFDNNVGVSICRNTGFLAATGEFIYFFDSDDVIEPDCLKLCFEKMKTSAYDFLVFDGLSFSDNGVKAGFNATYQRTRLLTKEEYTGKELIELLIGQKSYSCSVCLCFIRKTFLEENALSFYPAVLYEDVLYAAQMYLLAKRVSYVSSTLFRRRVRENSTMTSKITQKNIGYRITVANELLKLRSSYTDKESKYVLNNQSKSLLIFLIKSMLKNGQIWLLIKNALQINKIILRSL